MIPFVNLKTQYEALKPQIQERINRVLEHGQYLLGPEVGELEQRLATFAGAQHCISVSSGAKPVFVDIAPDTCNIDATLIEAKLKEQGIPTAVHYPVPLNEQPAYRHLCCPDCTPVAQQIARDVMSLPMHPDLSEGDQQRIVAALCS